MHELFNIPKVSVCVVTYNQENYIEECLTSIVTQATDFAFELLVGDDCSSDNTRAIIQKICDQYPDIVKPFFYEKNIGSAANYNHLHAAAMGAYVCHCDGDDLFLPGKLAIQAAYLDRHSDCSVVWHKVKMFNDYGQEANEYSGYDNDPEGQKVTVDYLLRVGTVACHSSIMYRKSAKKTYDPFFVALDLYYAIEFLDSGYGFILSNALGKYRVNSVNSFNINKKTVLKIRELCIKHWDMYSKKYPQFRSQMLIYAVVNFIIDAKNWRSTSLGFLKLIIKNFGTFSMKEMKHAVICTKHLRLPKLR